MPWNGYRDHEADIGDGWDALENCSLYKGGACIRRLGFGARVDLSSAVVRSGAELGNYALVGTAAGAILSITQSTGSVASLTTGLTTTNWPTWAGMNGRLYYSNGVEMRVSDSGTSVRTLGITAPSVAATASAGSSGGVVTAGTHLVRYRYADTTRGRLSNPSTAVSVVTTAGQKITAGYTVSGDSTVNTIYIEMTADGDSEYYRVATLSNTGVSTLIDISDEDLVLGVSAARDGEFQHSPPPSGEILVEHRQRLWLGNISTGTVYWSRPMYPESWDSTVYARRVTLDSGDSLSAMASFYSDLYVVGQRSMRRLVYTSDPGGAMVLDVPGNFGCFNQRCLLKVDGGLLVGWGRNGAWIVDAMQPKKISRPIDDTIVSLADSSNLTQRFICFEPIRREIHFVFPLSGETTCKAAAVWSIDRNEWTLTKWRNPMTAAVLNSSYSDRQRLMLCDANGYAWRVGVSANDGGGNGVVTVTSGSTTSVINGTNTAVVGQYAYFPATGEERRITVASGSQITLATAISSAPTAGSKVYIGSIRMRLVTDWWPGDGINDKKRPTGFNMAVRPDDDMGTAIVNYYQDFSGTAVEATSFAADTFAEGVSIADGDITVDFDAGTNDGYVSIPTPADWKRTLRAEIIAETPLDGIQFIECAFDKQSSIPVEKE